jgi:hypothetical protein
MRDLQEQLLNSWHIGLSKRSIKFMGNSSTFSDGEKLAHLVGSVATISEVRQIKRTVDMLAALPATNFPSISIMIWWLSIHWISTVLSVVAMILTYCPPFAPLSTKEAVSLILEDVAVYMMRVIFASRGLALSF